MGRRSRQRQQPAAAKPAPKRDRMARVSVTDQTWNDYRALLGSRPVSEALGALVEREVDRHHARRLKTGTLDDRELVDALDRARQQHADLTQIVTRLEQRLDRPAP